MQQSSREVYPLAALLHKYICFHKWSWSFLFLQRSPAGAKGSTNAASQSPPTTTALLCKNLFCGERFFYKYIEFLFLIELIFRCLDCLVSQDSLIFLINADFATKICMGKRRIIQIFIIFVVGWEFLALRW